MVSHVRAIYNARRSLVAVIPQKEFTKTDLGYSEHSLTVYLFANQAKNRWGEKGGGGVSYATKHILQRHGKRTSTPRP